MKGLLAIFGLIFCNFVTGDDYTVTIPTASGGYIEIPSSRNIEHDSDQSIPPQWVGPVPSEKEVYGKAHSVEKHGFPPGCANSDEKYKCDYMVSITLDAEGYPGQAYFKLSGKLDKSGHGYVAVGLSEDDKMGDDHIVECIKRRDKTHPLTYHSWSQYHNTPQRLKDDSELIHVERQEFDAETGYLTCEFTRPLISFVKYQTSQGLDKVKKFDLIYDQYCILLATGQLKSPTSEELGFHGKNSLGQSYVSRHPYKGYRSASNSLSFAVGMVILPLMTALGLIKA